MKLIHEFEGLLNYKFKDKKILIKAFTHKSFDKNINNEKLEFLGDRVLGLILSKKIYQLYPNEKEGDLDKRFASLVNKKTCFRVSQRLNLEKFIILGSTYTKKSKIEEKLISDMCESIIGAIYLDGGYNITEKLVLDIWSSEIKKTFKTEIDAKTRLQEYSLKIYKKLPKYNVIKSSGPKHSPNYKVIASINNSKKFIGYGKSIKLAQQKAADNLLKSLGI